MSASTAYIRAARRGLRAVAVEADAAPMQAYMKSAMPYYGVKKPERAMVSKSLVAAHPMANYSQWRDTARELYAEASFREERYAALDLVGHRHYREYRDRFTSFGMYQFFVDEGAWWDLVDETATHHLGALMRCSPEKCTPNMRRWSQQDRLWRQRAAIICQIKSKGATDEGLLFQAIEAAMDSTEFFLRKGIGWALREYGKTKPKSVVRFVRKHRRELSPLSKREALRRLIADGVIAQIP